MWPPALDRFCYPVGMERRITLIAPSGRRFDLTPRTPRDRIMNGLSVSAALLASAVLWALLLWPLVRAFL